MARNSSGTYSLPSGNPVVTNTKITSTWANTTLADVANEITNSLDRNGRGRMAVPILQPDGVVGLPAYSFISDPATGMYLPAVGTLGLTVAGTSILSADSLGVNIPNIYPPGNRIINGGMRVSQYGSATLAATGSLYGACDRFINAVTATTVSATIAQFADPVPGFSQYGLATQINLTTTGPTNVAFSQSVESTNTTDLNGKKVVFSTKVYQNTGSAVVFTPSLVRPTAGTDNYGTFATIVSGAPVSVPSGVATLVEMVATLGASDATNGVRCLLQSANFAAVTSKLVYHSNWYFNLGASTPTNGIENTSYADELAKCRRYARPKVPGFLIGNQYSTANAEFVLALNPPMRVSPSLTAINGNPIILSGGASANIAGTWSLGGSIPEGVLAIFTRTSGTWTIGQVINCTDTTAQFTLSAEIQ